MPNHGVVFVRSIMMPPSPIITAVSVKGIIYPTSLRTVWRPPKRMSPYGAHHTADDRTGWAGDEEARSRAKCCTNRVRSRIARRSCHESDECGREQCLPREGPNRKTRHFRIGYKQVRHSLPPLVLCDLAQSLSTSPTRRKLKRTIVAFPANSNPAERFQ